MADDWVMIRIYPGNLLPGKVFTAIQTRRSTPSGEVVRQALIKLGMPGNSRDFELVEVSAVRKDKERKLTTTDMPGVVQQTWFAKDNNLFALRRKDESGLRPEDQQERISRIMSGFNHPSTLNVADLCTASELTEEAMLENLSNRFHSDDIYTYVGSILVAVNPFKLLSIYQPKYVDMYRQQSLGKLAPHIYAVADGAYFAMLREKRNQCVVVSGESGSGKTESTKYLMRYLMALSNKAKAASVEERIVGTSVILEAFGNAKTVTNNNSSRFGKFICLKFREDGAYVSASIEKYLLEKSRINFQAEHERNYHVFYYLLAGADEALRKSLWLKKPDYYHYLNRSRCYQIEGEDEVALFNMLVQSMEKLRFSNETQRSVFTILAALLHLGNVTLVERSADMTGVEVKNMAQLKVVSDLLKVRLETLTAALTTRKNMARGETVIIPYSKDEAVGNRDAMAKSLYASLFDWMVAQMNKALTAKPGRAVHTGRSIGLLDIFGFEVFAVNSFEQFCINYANEQLQFYFNQHVFKLEQDEYNEEGIRWNAVDYVDNLQCLELISKRPTGLMHILDDESRLASSTDETLLQKFDLQHKDHPCFAVPQLKKNDPMFMINHYAGSVDYHIKGFREKNNDLIRPDVVAVLKSSTMPFLRQIVESSRAVLQRWKLIRHFVRAFCIFIRAAKRGREKRTEDGGQQNDVGRKLMSPSLPVQKSPSFDVYGRALSVQDRINNMSLEMKSINKNRPCSSGDVEGRERLSSGSVLQRRASNKGSKYRRYRTRSRHTKLETFMGSVGSSSPLTGSRSSNGYSAGFSRGSSQRRAASVGAQFMNSLSSLMETLSQAQPFFVRCIKSNASLTPGFLDNSMVLRQLRYTGMLETVRIRKAGYGIRQTFEDFRQSYWPLCRKFSSISSFLQAMELDPQHYQIGKTKVFLRASQQTLLQDKLAILLEEKIRFLQHWARGRLQRIEYCRIRQAIITIQSWHRGNQARKRYYCLRERSAAAVCIQATWKGYSIHQRFRRSVGAVKTMQRVCRGFLARRRSDRLREERRIRMEEEVKRRKEEERDREDKVKEAVTFEEIERVEAEVLKFIDNMPLTRRRAVSVPDKQLEMKEGAASAGRKLSHASTAENTRRTTVTGSGTRVGRLALAYEHGLVGGMSQKPGKPPDLETVTGRQVGRQRSPLLMHREMFEKGRSKSLDATGENTSRSLTTSPVPSCGSPTIRQRMESLQTKEKTIEQLDEDNKRKESRLADLAGTPTVKVRTETVSKSIKKTIKTNVKLPLRDRSISEGHKGPVKHQKRFKKELKSPTAKMIQGVIGAVVRSRSSDAVKIPKVISSQSDVVRPTNAHFLKAVTFKRLTNCSVCHKGITGFFKQGIKCSACQLCFHRHCIANANQCCGPPQRTVVNVSSHHVVSSPSQLLDLDRFLADKIAAYHDETETSGKRDNIVDVVFKSALREFHSHLVTAYAQATAESSGPFEPLTSDHLVNMFSDVLTKVLNVKQIGADFPVAMGLNAFKPLIDEFVNSRRVMKESIEDAQRKKGSKRQRKRQRKDKDLVEYNKHRFHGECCSTPTVCEVCCKLLEVLQTGQVCEFCKLTCHGDCVKKTKKCLGHSKDAGWGSLGAKGNQQQFGVALVQLAERSRTKLPIVFDLCINNLEVRGLFTEGLYRKSASAVQVRRLHKALNQDPRSVKLDEFSVHTVAAVVKQFLRDLPEPLLTFALYSEFVQATEIANKHARYNALFELTERLPKSHQDVLERIVYHLARVAQQEQSNKMSVYNLALIFAPCVMLPPKDTAPLEALTDLQKQRSCVECLIDGQKSKIKTTLSDLSVLDAEAYTKSKYLSVLSVKKARSSIHLQSPSERSSTCSEDLVDNALSVVDYLRELDSEEQKIKAELAELEKERTELTELMPTLQPRRRESVEETDEELSDTEQTKDGMSSGDELEGSEDESQYALTFDLPAAPSKLQHKNRCRVKLAKRRAPSRMFRKQMKNAKSTDNLLRWKETPETSNCMYKV
ncbi:unconventional myosin-IXa-like isoform X2 [Corticium candelabrum]|uniref:unconventional myosin-IXa-like isoform X2 n=1 Tax=Corticium candelabrum TaxID=121492 RepID=UPI002E267136|nr:unconventional myosin-IXa-like isoform X2 [Corticium candelabrum]